MEEDEVSYEVTAFEEELKVSPLISEVAGKKVVLKGTVACPGCGPQLGLKVALQLIDNCTLVTSSGCMRLIMKALSVPCFHGGLNAIAAAAGISKSTENTVLCFIGDGALSANLGALQAAAERNDNMICICYNNQGYCNLNKPFQSITEFARFVKAPYVATAAISHLEDYISKIKKASSMTGFRFIDLLSPCPVTMKIDSSNTMVVGKLAVETGVWPLYEIVEGRLTVTEVLRKFEPIERYLEMLKTSVSDEEKLALQNRIKRKWKDLNNGCV
ncbi:MAG: thiamine pyrophosphate-dependent enzyme [Candidatus Aenigmarchaeota archaeon]|nr:thiamine pyrophosphate-dependent enzyme [Candidatus Aenigmarchaeota archaeon]